MNKLYIRSLLPSLLFLMLGAANLMAQSTTTIAGTVKDATGETLAGVNIVVKGRVIGTITDTKGQYNLSVNQAPPITLVFSFVGFKTQEIEVKDANTTALDVSMPEENTLGAEIVVSANRYEESILKAPVTVEKMDVLAIKQAATPDFYDALANVKGVQVSSGSMNFTTVNTRGFSTIGNTRFVQLVDGIDTQAPVLNFPTGTIMGLSELDAESIELVPGAASALYGPNAFNGIMIMKSKSPFEYQGLSAMVKVGMTSSSSGSTNLRGQSSDGGGSNPMTSYSLRYAKAFNNKFAFKVGFSYFLATDWLGSDVKTERLNPESKADVSGKQNFDGLNTYGDEYQGIVTPVGVVTRTGFTEKAILDNRDAKTIKGDAAVHYRINDKIEAILAYRYGGGSSVYQGTEKYALRDFTQQFFRAEVKADNFFVRAYMTQTDAGKSYNLSGLGFVANEKFVPSATWAQDYTLAMQGYIPGVGGGDQNAARSFADRTIPLPGTQAFNDVMNEVRANYFQKPTASLPYGGAAFIDNSKMYHAEFNYNFVNEIKFAEVQVGANYRQFDLFSNGTIFNEDPNGTGTFSRIKINQHGEYIQVAKSIADVFKLTGSIRYDKSDNFEGRITPRISGVVTINENHNIRGSFQTGFRNPDTQAQYIYFPSSGGTIVGGTADNASRYGIYNGSGAGSYTKSSFDAYKASGGSINTGTGALVGGNQSVLVTADLNYVKPERLSSFEIGYKGLFGDGKMLVDINAYWTTYNDFLGGQYVNSKAPTTQKGAPVAAGTLYSAYTNATQTVYSNGLGVGLNYNLPRNFALNGSYSFATFTAAETADFNAGFNTPQNKYSIGLANRKLAKNLGMNVNFRYQDGFQWQSSYGNWNVPSFGVVDAQVNYKLTSYKTMIKIGGTNIGGGDYRTNFGAPYVGQTYYVSLVFDQFLN